MKGVIFTEFVEMVEQRYSQEIADRMLDESDLPSGGAYTSVGNYDHRELGIMIGKMAEISGEAVPGLIHTFGLHLFGRFLLLYPSFFVGIASAMDFLASIEDVIHAEVRKLYPDVELPNFDVSRPEPNRLVLTYHSQRHLGDLAHGLIEACISHYGIPLSLHREDLPGEDHSVRFTLSV